MKKNLFVLFALAASLLGHSQLPNINLVQVATGFSSPIGFYNCGDDRLFVVEQAGKIKIMNKAGVISATPFLTLDSVVSAGNEQGLLGLAFSPNYKQDGFFYVNYIFKTASSSGATRISRFSVDPLDSNLAVASSEHVILQFNQPYTNHNGASLMFGKDGYLYDGQGDGGSEYDPNGYGQTTNDYLSVMLRFDVSNTDTTYIVPPTNPFVGQSAFKPETWAYGLRNPWRCSFDRITGDLWMGDVGQDNYEEVDFQSVSSTGGENYGWKCREGFHACSTCTVTGCPSTGFTDPVFEYSHSYQSVGTSSCSITGGYVYRGTQYSALWGRYIFTDYCNGRFFSLKQTGPNTFDPDTLNDFSNQQYTSFGEDNNGELYVCYRGSGTGGKIYRLTETTSCNPNAFISLNDTIAGCSPVAISALRGDTLSYQWYNVNGVINGATSYQYPASQSGWYKVKVSKTLHAGCEAMSDSIYVIIHDTAAITPGTGSHSLCQNGTPVSLSGYLNPTGGTYSGSAVSNNTFVPTQLGANAATIAYTYVNQFSCVSHGSVSMQVNDTTALVKNPLDSVFCVSDGPVSLNGFFNYPGVFSGTGVANDDSTFNPASAGVGWVPIHFIYTDNHACQSTLDIAVTVGDKTALTIDSAGKQIGNCQPDFSLNGFIVPTGGDYAGTAVSNNTFSPAAINTQGPAKVYYTYTNNFGCTSTDSVAISVLICEGIQDITDAIAFSIFPNPGNGKFFLNVKVNSMQKAELIITDALGKICYRGNQLLDSGKPVIAIEPRQLAKGTYTVQLKSDKGSAVRSLVVE